jgi:hypothetical protein
MTPTAFKLRHRAFRTVADDICQRFLDAAALKCPAATWYPEATREEGIGLWAAHLLSQEPEGRELRFTTDKTGATAFERAFREMEREAGFGPVVV